MVRENILDDRAHFVGQVTPFSVEIAQRFLAQSLRRNAPEEADQQGNRFVQCGLSILDLLSNELSLGDRGKRPVGSAPLIHVVDPTILGDARETDGGIRGPLTRR